MKKDTDINKTKTITINRKTFHDFHILRTYEAGISLLGTEVKSIKAGNINLRDGFVFIKNGEAFLRNVHISQYSYGNRINHDPLRERKLLLHKDEIMKLSSRVKEKGFTLIPLKVYIKKGIIKLEIGLARGKASYQKKEAIRKKDEIRELRKSFKTSTLSGKLK